MFVDDVASCRVADGLEMREALTRRGASVGHRRCNERLTGCSDVLVVLTFASLFLSLFLSLVELHPITWAHL